MEQLLDLSIIFSPPPQGSPSEVIAAIGLRCDPLGIANVGDLLVDPLREQDREDLRWYLEEYWKWPYEQFALRARLIEDLLPTLGNRLYRAAFGSRMAMGILQAWRLVPAAQRQISIVSDMPKVLSLPWELLHDEQSFLALRSRTPISIVRRLSLSEQNVSSVPFEPPLRVLLITARPDDAGFIDPRGITRELLDELQEHIDYGSIAVEFLRPPTLLALRARLVNTKLPPIHVLHFDGHGVFDREKSVLVFENDEGAFNPIEGGELAQVLQNSNVKLVVLTACQSAMSSSDDPFSSIAVRLIKGGVDTVVAMSTNVLVTSAAHYVVAFYRALAAGTPVTLAQERARQVLYAKPERHLIRRSKEEEGEPVKLRDWWLPHFYQQRPLALQLAKLGKKSSRKKKLSTSTSLPSLNDNMPPEPRYGFYGRAHELLQMERWLMRRKLIIIHGFGGVGKTALVREAADWLTRTGMYMGACFVSFEHGGDAAYLLGELGRYLGIYDRQYNPNDKPAVLARLKPVLKEKRPLIIADSLESVFPQGDASLEASTRTQVWDVLLDLASLGVGVLLTTRDITFDDSRMTPGEKVVYLPLLGLHPEDAYLLASQLLDRQQIDRAQVPYAELRDLLKQLDYHPLAIQLVLPALRELPLLKIRTDFGALLPKFTDDAATGRNKSLLALLDYSLRRLSEEQRALLPRLALFEGGASEDDLLAITEIPESEWDSLRLALGQGALLMEEQIHEDVAVLFLRFHPTLAPYLRTQPGANDEALIERYAQRYYKLANYLYDQDKRYPQPVRVLVQLELPNLRKALELLLKMGKIDDASIMVDRIAGFLNIFGQGRERDELRWRVAESVNALQTQESRKLTQAEYLRESGLGEDELSKGDLHTASARFTQLLVRITSLPEGLPLGRGSYEHARTLDQLARCLRAGGQITYAERRLSEALAVVDGLIKQTPDNPALIGLRSVLLADIGSVLVEQGQYQLAQDAYEEALRINEQLGNLRNQAVLLGQLGFVALQQRDYDEARMRYIAALERFRYMGEPTSEAIAWHQLGIIATEQHEWAEAERCYRESLAIEERLGGVLDVAMTCNQLAVVAQRSGHPDEAEGWFKRALEIYEPMHTDSYQRAKTLSNLANLLVNEVRLGRSTSTRLLEAKRYAEQALSIAEALDASSEIWNPLGILAHIAELDGQIEVARNYRRREREVFAAFAGNRYRIDQQFGTLIVDIAAASQGDKQARERVEIVLPMLEEAGWRISAPILHIWEGERDWHSLTDDLDREDALLMLRVLEILAQPAALPSVSFKDSAVAEPLFHYKTSRYAVEPGDATALHKSFEAFSPKMQEVTNAEERAVDQFIDAAIQGTLQSSNVVVARSSQEDWYNEAM